MSNTNSNTTVLVTGGTGFVGIHCILQLLQKGYKVKTTIRTPSRRQEVLDMLSYGGIPTPLLEFIEADLTKDANWDEAAKDCTYVLHVASPIFLEIPKNENEMITPAVDGTLRVLKAAKRAGVKRIVLTSSFGAPPPPTPAATPQPTNSNSPSSTPQPSSAHPSVPTSPAPSDSSNKSSTAP